MTISKRIGLLLLLLATSQVWGQSKPAHRDYFYDFGIVWGAIHKAAWLKEACDQAVPQSQATNQQALDVWQSRNKALFVEIESQFGVMGRYWAQLPQPAKESRRTGEQTRQEYEAYKPTYIASLRAFPTEKLDAACNGFPHLLLSPAMNIEDRYRSELASIRTGPRM